MKNQLGYLLTEAFRGFRSDKFLSITSVITIGICTSVFAGLLLAVTMVWTLGGGGSGDSVIRVFPKAQFEKQTDLDALEGRLHRLAGIDSIVFISKDDALQEFKRDFGDEMVRSLDWNPLPHSFLLFPKEGYRSSSQNRLLLDRIKMIEEVETASANSLYLDWMDKWRYIAGLGAGILMLIVAGALSLIIHNAVKLNLYSRKTLVTNMKYCGAGELFILTPFLLEGILLGFFGSLIGVITLAILMWISRLISPSLQAQVPFWPCAFTLLTTTSIIAAIASTRTVRAFLRGTAY